MSDFVKSFFEKYEKISGFENKKGRAGDIPSSCSFLTKNPADAGFGKMIVPAKLGYGHACGPVPANASVPVEQFGPVISFLSPRPTTAGFSGNVQVGTVHILLDLPDQFFRKEFFCFYIAHVCLQ